MPTPTETPVDARAVTLWRLQRLIRLGLFGLPVSVAAGIGLSRFGGLSVGVAAGAALFLIQALSALLWPALEYGALRYSLREHDLLVRRGVLFRHWSSVPYNRIQHVDTHQGPVERALGLGQLLVYTASGMSADGSVPGLRWEEAERLRDLLSRRGGDDGV